MSSSYQTGRGTPRLLPNDVVGSFLFFFLILRRGRRDEIAIGLSATKWSATIPAAPMWSW